ncbi:MAG: exonuclease SbcCD subunit D, partial [Lachnospiraceae bacterium]|nr:exonuclease SbcCD subunit D [Lachnospiraceae bacterium]
GDQAYILERIRETAKDRQADAVLIAGDVFDRPVPSEAAVRLLDSFLTGLAADGITVCVISGNHDSDDRLAFGSRLFEANGIYISSKYEGTLKKLTMKDAYGSVNIYMLPFVKASQVRHYHPDEEIETYDDAVKAVIRSASPDTSERNVIVAHQFVAQPDREPEISGSEGVSVQSVGLVEKVGYDAFDGFDYAALGHIHSPQKVKRDEVRYCGSMLKYSVSEAGHEKSMPLVTLREKGDVAIELIPLIPIRDLRRIRGPIKKLLSAENVTDAEDFISATLTDPYPPEGAMGLFRQVYPNTLKIEFDNDHTREIMDVFQSVFKERKTYEELVGDFYSEMYGTAISDEEMKIMREAAAEAGIQDEAD